MIIKRLCLVYFFKLIFPRLSPSFVPDLLELRGPPLTLFGLGGANGPTDGGDISDPSGSEIQLAE